jgi:hypothetical protein
MVLLMNWFFLIQNTILTKWSLDKDRKGLCKYFCRSNDDNFFQSELWKLNTRRTRFFTIDEIFVKDYSYLYLKHCHSLLILILNDQNKEISLKPYRKEVM